LLITNPNNENGRVEHLYPDVGEIKLEFLILITRWRNQSSMINTPCLSYLINLM